MKRNVFFEKALFMGVMTLITLSTGCSGTKAGSSGVGAAKQESKVEKSYDPASIDDKKMIAVAGGSVKTTDENKDVSTYFTRIEKKDNGQRLCHTIQISPYSIGQYEVTYELWSEVVAWATSKERGTKKFSFNKEGWNGFQYKDGEECAFSDNKKYPVTNVGFYDIIVWCNAFSEMSGYTPCYYLNNEKTVVRSSALDSPDDIQFYTFKRTNGFRLPTEAEWEFAARGGNPESKEWSYKHSGSENFKEVGWFSVSDKTGRYEGVQTHSVGQKKPNTLGIYDMSGNAAEYCTDRFYDSEWFKERKEETDPIVDPVSDANRSTHVYRGDQCINILDVATYKSVNDRHEDFIQSQPLGFRLARSE